MFITVRNRSCGRVMFLHLSVILSAGGVCPSACWDTHPPGQPPLEADTPGKQTPPRKQTTPGKQAPPGKQTPPWEADIPPAQCMLGYTGNKRAVRILLKCILVICVFLLPIS